MAQRRKMDVAKRTLVRVQGDRDPGFNLSRRKISAKKRPDIGITHKPNKPNNHQENQKLDQFTQHILLPVYLSFPETIYGLLDKITSFR